MRAVPGALKHRNYYRHYIAQFIPQVSIRVGKAGLNIKVVSESGERRAFAYMYIAVRDGRVPCRVMVYLVSGEE